MCVCVTGSGKKAQLVNLWNGNILHYISKTKANQVSRFRASIIPGYNTLFA